MRSLGFFCLAYQCAIHGFALFVPFLLTMLVLRYVQWAAALRGGGGAKTAAAQVQAPHMLAELHLQNAQM
jgi:hypothetical protein